MIRLSEALARMRLEERVTAADVQEAVRLMRVATLAAATDKATGLVDLGAIATGHSANDRGILEAMSTEIRRLIEAHPRGEHIPLADLRDELQAQSDADVDQQLFIRAIRDLADDDILTHNSRNASVLRR